MTTSTRYAGTRRLIHHGWPVLTAALAVALAPTLTCPSTAQDYRLVKNINDNITFHPATTAALAHPNPGAAAASKPLEPAADAAKQL